MDNKHTLHSDKARRSTGSTAKSKWKLQKASPPKGTSFRLPVVHCDKDGRNLSTKPKKVEQIKEESRISITNIKSPKIIPAQCITQTIILH